MKNIKEYKKFISYTINQISSCLKRLGYSYQSDELYIDSLDLEHVRILFSNNSLNRIIEFNYSKFIYNGISGSNVSVFIENDKRSYILQDILEYENVYYNKSQFSLLNYEGDFEQQVANFYCFLIELFEKEQIKLWLLGEKWGDIPFDWGDYK